MKHPLGLMVAGDPDARSPQRVDGTGIVFFCKVKEGTNLAVLKTEDIVIETSKALDGAIEKLGSLSGILSFNCILLRDRSFERQVRVRRTRSCLPARQPLASTPTARRSSATSTRQRRWCSSGSSGWPRGY